MAATNQSENRKNTKFYQLKAKVDETNNPYFGLSEKVDNKWQTTQKFDTISGYLAGASIKESEYEGVKKKSFVLVIEDDNETSQIEMTHNLITWSIINTLASAVNSPTYNKLSKVLIQVWKKENNGKWWGQAKVEVDGQKSSWKFDPKTAPKKEQVFVNGQPFKQNGKDVYDDTKLKAFYEDVFTKDVISKFSASNAPNTPKNEEKQENSGVTDDDLDSLPF